MPNQIISYGGQKMFVHQLTISQIREILTKILRFGDQIENIEIHPFQDHLYIEYDNYYEHGAAIVREEVILQDCNASRIGDEGYEETVRYRKYMFKLFGQPYKDYINWM
jgi:hypothetical protein